MKQVLLYFLSDCQVEKLLSSSMSSSASTPSCPTVSSVFKTSQQPKIYSQVPGIPCTDQTPALLERRAHREGLFMYFIKVLKDERYEDADAQHSGLPLASDVQLF